MRDMRRDMLVLAVVVFCLTAVGSASPLVCEELVQPLVSPAPRRFEGRWALVAGSLNHSRSMEALARRDSISVSFSSSGDASTYSYTQINRFGDRCQRLPYNVSVDGGAFAFDAAGRFGLAGAFLRTSCPDCLVMRWSVRSERRDSTDLYLLSRGRQVEPGVMEEFRAQLRCFQLPEPVVMDPTKELCPERAGTSSSSD